MALSLHKKCKERFAAVLNQVLPRCTVNHNKFLDYDSTEALDQLNDVLPQHGSGSRDQLEKSIGSGPASLFVRSRLDEMLGAREYLSETAPTPLGALPGATPVGALAEQLVAEFDSLPWKYDALPPLPEALSQALIDAKGIGEVELGSGCSLFVHKEGASPFPTHVDPEGLQLFAAMGLRPGPSGLIPGRVYLRGRLDGFIPHYGTGEPIKDFTALVRGVLGILTSLLLTKHSSGVATAAQVIHVVLYRDDGEGRTFVIPRELDTHLAVAINSQVIHDGIKAERLNGWINHAITRLQTVLGSAGAEDRIVRAASWLFDGEATTETNPHLAFIQTTVALEILFGDRAISNELGLTELLANRCAYLIGKTRSDRLTIQRDFKRAYSTRSRIVHSGHERLTSGDYFDLFALRFMARRAIWEELELLAKDVQGAKP
jgi:hypothetical protein